MSWYRKQKVATVFDQIPKVLGQPDAWDINIVKQQTIKLMGILEAFDATDPWYLELAGKLTNMVQSLKTSKYARMLDTEIMQLEAYMSDPNISQYL